MRDKLPDRAPNANKSKAGAGETREEKKTWLDNRQDCLSVISEAAARVIVRPLWIVFLCCMRDTTGAEIERHLRGCADLFREVVTSVCLHGSAHPSNATVERTWEDWRARRLAVICLMFAYLSQRSEYHGAVVWVVRGIPKGAIRVATRINTLIGGAVHIVAPHLNTIWTDLAELQAVGILAVEQFDHVKVPDWGKGKPKTHPDGSPMLDRNGDQMQFAFNYYMLLICPWKNGADGGRVIPIPRGAIRRKMKAPPAEPQSDIDRRKAEQRAGEISAAEMDQVARDIEYAEQRLDHDRNADERAALAGDQSRQIRATLKKAAPPSSPSPSPAPTSERARFNAAHRAMWGSDPPD